MNSLDQKSPVHPVFRPLPTNKNIYLAPLIFFDPPKKNVDKNFFTFKTNFFMVLVLLETRDSVSSVQANFF